MSQAIHQFNWCPEYNHIIDYELVKEMKPDCIAENNGCGNCPKSTSKEFSKTEKSLTFREIR